MVLMAVLLPVLALLAAFCINAAHMQLSRTELMVATDASARAGGRAFSEAQSVQEAKLAAMTTAALNNVNGAPLRVNMDDGANEIEFGITTQPDGPDGRYYFEKYPTAMVESGQVIANAVRVNGRRERGSLSGSVPMILPGLLDMSEFEPVQDAVAMQVDRDISLVLDRSGSMGMLNVNWPEGTDPWTRETFRAAESAGIVEKYRGSYRYTSGNNSTTFQQWAWEDHFGLGPAPSTPWQDLVRAVNEFLDVLNETPQNEQVSIASYATSGRLDTWLETDYPYIRQVVDEIEVGGNTAIGEGMQEAIQAMLDRSARPYAAKTMVVMTDGNHNRGISPVAVAIDFSRKYNLTIHTVTFGAGANQGLMRVVASKGGGEHYHAANGQQLADVFEEIANNLPTMLTE